MTAVLKHELRNYFHSFTAYVFGAFLLAIVGFGSMLYNLQAAVSNFEYVLSFGSIVFVVIVPILTMRVIAEERRQKTDQLLYSLPISTTQVVLGKYVALLTVYLIPLGRLVSSEASPNFSFSSVTSFSKEDTFWIKSGFSGSDASALRAAANSFSASGSRATVCAYSGYFARAKLFSFF